MTQSVARILSEAEQLSASEREDLADGLMEILIRDIPPDIQKSHLAEVRRRIAEVESGAVTLVPGEEALQRVRRLVESAQGKS